MHFAQVYVSDELQLSSSHTKVSVCHARLVQALTPSLGARHLYLSDYDPTNLPDLKATIEKAYPDVKVRLTPLVVRNRP